ncbi:cytochrome P450 [Aspergillus pseudonomiae]|uniref:Dihydromonacolin L monooxygenase LovA n=1 Tax=Aspergillus pseudonomiae TaxID=1506151 RepID=A0A5N6HMB0_9EURO|nr:cytochrome P450 [Aspergillus pseudonomiae]KAB8255566.1 cytochrome P450 [Aspergillus pseudonomiae]KAE8403031.1 cytochrome P450 [Aspergillus pseudonomiae]
MPALAEILESHYFFQGIAVALTLIFVSNFYRELADGLPYRKIPLVGRSRWEISNTKAKKLFVTSAKDLMVQGFSQGRTVFQAMFTSGPTIVLHPCYADELKNHPQLDFRAAVKKLFFGATIRGFEPFGDQTNPTIGIEVINKKLTHMLSQLTIPLSKETAAVLTDKLPGSDEWKPFTFGLEVPHIVARVSSLVFMGEKICRNEAWLNVSVNYTIDAFNAARELRDWPAVSRPFIHWLLPSMQKLRHHKRVAAEIVQQEINRRDMIREGTLPEDKPPRTHTDALDWFREVAAGRPYDETVTQIALSVAAIHTTSNMLTNVMYDLTAHPEYIQPLRDEIKAIVEEDGILKKPSLSKMKLMDSVMKESQRINPISIAFFNRVATESFVLSDGTYIPKGANVTMSGHTMEDETVYPNAKVYDGFRFYNKRQVPGNEHRYQFVTTSPEHLGFGHGMHACPGRFFANNEIKILLVHLLMKYDWRFADHVDRPQSILHGTEIMSNPTVKLLYKSRQPEIDLSALEEGTTD